MPREASAHRLGSLRSWEIGEHYMLPRLQPRALQLAGMTFTVLILIAKSAMQAASGAPYCLNKVLRIASL